MKATFLSRFTPSLMTPEALEALFVQRQKLADRLHDLVSDSINTKRKHHVLLIGPRGIGKTHLISLAYHRIKSSANLQNKLLIAWLREEEWGVSSFLDLLLRVLRSLVFEYKASALEEKIEHLYSLRDAAAERRAKQILHEFLNERVLLILVENLDDLFAGLGEQGQKRLRAYLQENPVSTIIATSQALFNGISLQTSPFYGFFRLHHLEELTLDEAHELLINIARFEGDEALATFINTPTGRARIRAIHHLAGGNHRVYVIFSQFLTQDSLDDLIEPFMRTLDDLTPYYQARMTWLSLQQRKIVELLNDRRGAVSVKEIANRCFVTHQTASSQLKILRDMGYVRAVREGRQSYYELQEPLMRLCIEVKKHRAEPIRLFVDFLRFWYSRAELQDRLDSLEPDSIVEGDYLRSAIQRAESEAGDPVTSACLIDLQVQLDQQNYEQALRITDELVEIRGATGDWINRGFCLAKLNRNEEALLSFERSIQIEPTCIALGDRGTTLTSLERYNEALESFDKALEIDSAQPGLWRMRAWTLLKLERYDEAAHSYEQAIQIAPSDPENVEALVSHCNELEDRQLYEQALQTITRAIELDSNNGHAWLHFGLTLGKLDRHQEAAEAFSKVVAIQPTSRAGWGNRGIALSEIGNWQEAIRCFDKTIELDPTSARSWARRGSALMAISEHEQALKSLNRAIELDPQSPWSWRIMALVLDHVGRYHEALDALNKSIELGATGDCIYFNRVELLIGISQWKDLKDALSQALKRPIDAEHVAQHTRGMLSNLLRSALPRIWKTVVPQLIRMYKRTDLIPLAVAFVDTLPVLVSPVVDKKIAEQWQAAWEIAATDIVEFALPLRLLSVAIAHRKRNDTQLFLQLPVEERKLLDLVLKKIPKQFPTYYMVQPKL